MGPWPYRKQRRRRESREHVQHGIIAYLLARVHLAPCTHINRPRVPLARVGADNHFVTSTHAPGAHPMGIEFEFRCTVRMVHEIPKNTFWLRTFRYEAFFVKKEIGFTDCILCGNNKHRFHVREETFYELIYERNARLIIVYRAKIFLRKFHLISAPRGVCSAMRNRAVLWKADLFIDVSVISRRGTRELQCSRKEE